MSNVKTKFQSPDRIPVWGDWEGRIQFEKRIDMKNKVEFVLDRRDISCYGEARCKGIHFFIAVNGMAEILELVLVKSADYKQALKDRPIQPERADYKNEIKGYNFFEPYTGAVFPMHTKYAITTVKKSIELLKSRFNGGSDLPVLSNIQIETLDKIIKKAKGEKHEK